MGEAGPLEQALEPAAAGDDARPLRDCFSSARPNGHPRAQRIRFKAHAVAPPMPVGVFVIAQRWESCDQRSARSACASSVLGGGSAAAHPAALGDVPPAGASMCTDVVGRRCAGGVNGSSLGGQTHRMRGLLIGVNGHRLPPPPILVAAAQVSMTRSCHPAWHRSHGPADAPTRPGSGPADAPTRPGSGPADAPTRQGQGAVLAGASRASRSERAGRWVGSTRSPVRT